MTAKEKKFRELIFNILKENISPGDFDLSIVESHATSPGIPDVNYCVKGVEGWIELKQFPKIDIKTSQVRWFRERVKAGGFPLFVVGGERSFYVVPGDRVTMLTGCRTEDDLLNISTTILPKTTNSRQLVDILMSPQTQYGRV